MKGLSAAILLGIVAMASPMSRAQVRDRYMTPQYGPQGAAANVTPSRYSTPRPYNTAGYRKGLPGEYRTPEPLNSGGRSRWGYGRGAGAAPTASVNAVRGTPGTLGLFKREPRQASAGLSGQYQIPEIRFPPGGIETNLYFFPLDATVREKNDFEITVVLNNTKSKQIDRFRFTIAYDPSKLTFEQYDASPLESYLDKKNPQFTVNRAPGRLTIEATLRSALINAESPLILLRFVSLGVAGTTSLRFLAPPEAPAGLFVKDKNLLGSLAHGLSGLLPANVFVVPDTTESEESVLAEAGLAFPRREDRAKGWLEVPADARLDAPVWLALQGPEITQRAVGKDFWVDLVLYNDEMAPIDSLGATIAFDPKVLQAIDEDQGNWIARGVNVWDGAFHESYPFNLHRANSADNARGLIRYEAGSHYQAYPYPTGILARIHFRSIAPAKDTAVRIVREAVGGKPQTYVNAYGVNRLERLWAGTKTPRVDLCVVAQTAPAQKPRGK
jgi:hypothetical protein